MYLCTMKFELSYKEKDALYINVANKYHNEIIKI